MTANPAEAERWVGATLPVNVDCQYPIKVAPDNTFLSCTSAAWRISKSDSQGIHSSYGYTNQPSCVREKVECALGYRYPPPTLLNIPTSYLQRESDLLPVNWTNLTSLSLSSTPCIVLSLSTSCDFSCILSVTSLAFALVISSASASELSCACAASYLVRAAKNMASSFWKVARALLCAVWALASSWGGMEKMGSWGKGIVSRDEVVYLYSGFLNLL
jgi:hypothetical protein